MRCEWGGSQLILALPAQLENDEASPRGHSEQGSKYCLNSAYFWDAWNAWNAWGGLLESMRMGGPRLSLIVLLGCSRCTTRFRVLTQASWMLCVVHENCFNRALLASHQNEECGGRVVQFLGSGQWAVGCGRTCWWSAPVLVKAGCARQGGSCTYVRTAL